MSTVAAPLNMLPPPDLLSVATMHSMQNGGQCIAIVWPVESGYASAVLDSGHISYLFGLADSSVQALDKAEQFIAGQFPDARYLGSLDV